jgi:hypothetical protein
VLSSAVALLDGFFEHPATIVISAPYVRFHSRILYHTEFFRSLLKRAVLHTSFEKRQRLFPGC